MEFTKPLQWAAAITSISTLLTYTNIIPSTMSNIILVGLFSTLYILFGYKRGGFSLQTLIPIVLSLGIVMINKDPSMVSLILLWIIFDLFKNAQINTQLVAKSFFISGVSGYLLVVCAYFTIHLNKHADLEMWRINHMITRSSLGFQQPNASMMYALAIIMSMLIAYKMTISKSILTIILTFILYHFNQSRTAFILILLIVILNQLKIVWPWPRLIFVLTGITSYVVMCLPINNSLDQLLSGRLTLYHSYFNELGINLIGNPLSDSKMIDNSYIQMLFSKGVLFTVVFAITILILFKTDSKLGKLLVLAYILSAFTESTFLHFDLLFPVLLATLTNIQNRKKNSKTYETNAININCSTCV